ncbi:MAG: hypothetical protein IJQ93_10595, partial [Bacteroidales bacterium]|nr:hypothetical protein [Bacteroidales bacterium]
AAGEAKVFAVHSPSFFFNPRGDEPWKYRSNIIPSKIHTLDMRGSGGYDFDYHVDYEHTPKVFKLRRYDGKNLNQGLMLSVKYADASPRPMPTIEIGSNEDGSDGGKWVKLTNMILPYGDLPIKVVKMSALELYGCTGDMIYMPQNITYLAVGASSDGGVNYMPYASGTADIKEVKVLDNNVIIGISAKVQEGVTVSGCPSLKEAYFTGSPISRFQMDNVPALNSLSVGKCTNLTMEVPPVFEQLWESGGWLAYDQRYEYTYGDGPYTTEKGTKFNYTDNGYGFYYAGEPAQGYHRDPR